MQLSTANSLHSADVQGVSVPLCEETQKSEETSKNEETGESEETLKTSLAMLQQVVNQLPQAIGWKDKDAVFLGCNQAFAQAVGLTHPAEIVGKAASEMQWQQQRADFLYTRDRDLIEQQQAEYHQLEVLPHPEQPLYLDISHIPLYSEQGTVEGVLAVIEDVTGTEATLRQSEATNRALINAVPDLLFRIRQDETYLDVQSSKSFKLLNPENLVIGTRVSNSLPPVLAQQRMHYVQKALDTGELQIYEQELLIDGVLKFEEVRIVPCQTNEVLAMVRDITDRKQAEKDLQLARFSVEYASDSVLWIRPNAQIIYANRAACQSLGYTLEELRSLTVFDIDAALPPDAWAEHWQQLQQQKSLTLESTHQTKDGRLYPVEVIVSYFALEGEEYNFVRVRDITERKQAEDALKMTQFSIDRAADAIWWVECDGTIAYINDAGCHDLGYPREEILGKRVSDFNPEFPAEAWADHWQEMKQKGASTIESVNQHRDGSIYPIEASVNYVAFGEKEFHCTFVRNISDRKQAEAALKMTQFSVDRASDPVWWIESDGLIAYVNDAACCAIGYTRDEMLTKRVYDFDPGFSAELWLDHWQELKLRGSFTFETSHQNKDSTIYPVEVTVNYLELNGKEFNCAFVRNIADRKQAEAALKMTQFSVDRASDAIWWVKPDGSICYVNDATCREIGYTREEILGKRIHDFAVGFTDAAWAHHWEAIKERGSFSFETQNQHKNGTIYPVEVTVNYIELNGNAINCSFVRNISDRKQAEAALRESAQQMCEQAERERLLNRLLTRIRNSLDFDTILETTLQEVQNFTEADRCQFAWYNANSNDSYWEVVKESHYDGLPSLVDRYPVLPTSPLLLQLQELQILRVEDVETLPDSNLLQFVNRFGYKAMLAIPMHVRSGLLGTIFCCHSTETRSWSDSDIELIQAVMAQLAIALTQAELYTQSRTKAQELEQALRELQRTQTQMVQSEKMSSLGQLVAGVAHEINNPVNFIYGNLNHASSYAQDLLHLIQLYQQHYPNPLPAIQTEADAIDLDFLLKDFPKLLTSMKIGAERIQEIVLSLRNFSRMDEAEVKRVDIHEGIDSTLMILQSRLRENAGAPGILVIKQYGHLPRVECFPGQLNQVFMNLLANAIDALEESIASGAWSAARTPLQQEKREAMGDRQPTIRIQTEQLTSGEIVIKIADNGCGMTQAQQRRLFDPFFTTKAVGKGTGLGLSISYQIVVEKHGGSLTCFSVQGEGTEFCIEIPTAQRSA